MWKAKTNCFVNVAPHAGASEQEEGEGSQLHAYSHVDLVYLTWN